MRFLIAGFGSIGRRHLRNLHALGETDILLYRTHRSTLPDDETQDLPVETDLAAALAHRPDAVIVANPTAAHLDVAIPAAGAGCALLIEKPVTHSLERTDELSRAVEKNGGRLLVGFQFRFHPGLQAAKQLLEEGAIGRPVSARAHWGEYLPGWHPWEDYRQGYSARADLGGGVVLTLSHPIDYLGWLLGEVDRVSAETASLGDLGIGVEDTAEMIFRFREGPLASLHLDYLQRPPEHTLEIVGTEGTLRWDNATGETALFHGTAPLKTFPVPAGFERNDLFLAEMRHFIEVARGEAQPLCPLSAGLRAVELALAVHRSSAEGQVINV
jgi:predicted dehydrogenase